MTRKLFPNGCPTSLQLAELVEGVAAPEAAQAILAHAAECDTCAQLLRQMTANQEGELTEAEQILVDGLIAPARPPSGKVVPISRLRSGWVPVVAAAAVIAAVSLWSLLRSPTGEVDGLLRQAYTARRPFEWRLPDAGHARVVRELGPGDRAFSRPPALLEAQARIARHLNSSNPRALLGKGWAELLDFDTPAAVRTLEKAKAAAPGDVDITLLLGVAYAARGESDNSAADLARAVDNLTEVLSRQPGNALALYNRALAHQRLSLLPLAIDDWKSFLHVETKGPWVDEARVYLAEAEKIVQHHRRLLDRPNASAEAFLREDSSHLPLDTYLDRPVLEWMLDSSPIARQAVELLARRLEKESRDHWLRDLIRQGSASRPDAVRTLLRMYDLNRAGKTPQVLHSFESEYRALVAQGLEAAAARAASERLYARYRSFSTVECGKALADPTLKHARTYPYLEIQILTNLGNAMLYPAAWRGPSPICGKPRSRQQSVTTSIPRFARGPST